MKKVLLSSMALMLTLALSACGGSKEAAAPAPATPAPAAPAEGSAPAAEPAATPDKPAEGSAPVTPIEPDTSVTEALEDAADAAGDAVEEMAEDAGEAIEEAAEAVEEAVEDAAETVEEEMAGGNLDKLIGSTWAFEDGTTLKFKDKETVNISGGQVSFLGENGIDASFEFNEADGTFEMSAMGQSRSGTFDGESLTIDGNAATMQ